MHATSEGVTFATYDAMLPRCQCEVLASSRKCRKRSSLRFGGLACLHQVILLLDQCQLRNLETFAELVVLDLDLERLLDRHLTMAALLLLVWALAARTLEAGLAVLRRCQAIANEPVGSSEARNRTCPSRPGSSLFLPTARRLCAVAQRQSPGK
jgi:hypothetical protein